MTKVESDAWAAIASKAAAPAPYEESPSVWRCRICLGTGTTSGGIVHLSSCTYVADAAAIATLDAASEAAK